MRLITLIATAFLGVSTFAAQASAPGCDTAQTTEISVGPVVVYLDQRQSSIFGHTFGDVFLYLESNGVAGLQRGGTNGVYYDVCLDSQSHDQLLV